MPIFSIKNTKIYHNLSTIRDFSRKIAIKPSDFAASFFLSIVAVGFESFSALLMIPLAKAVVAQKIDLQTNIPVLKSITDYIMRYPISFRTGIALLIIAITAITLLKTIFSYLSGLAATRQFLNFSYKIKNLIFKRYLQFGKLFFDKTSQGYLSDIIMFYANELVNQLMNLQSLFFNFILFVVYSVFMVTISWQMTIFVIVVFGLQHFLSKKVSQKIARTSRAFADSQQNISTQVFNILSCIPLVKAYNREKDEERRFDKINSYSRDLQFSMAKKATILGPFYEVTTQTTLLALLLATVFLIKTEGYNKLPLFLVYFYIAKKSSVCFGVLLNFGISISTASGIITNLLEIFNDKDKFYILDGERKFNGLRNSIELRHLNFSYSEKIPVLQDVNFSIKKGEITAIVGPTGTGKTTIISLILRFYDCPPDSILLDGIDIKDFIIPSVRSHIALVSQDVQLFNDTIKNNITYGMDSVENEKIEEIIEKAQLTEFIRKLPQGLETRVGDRGIKLSGGEKQRVSIARALLKNSEILILDEATSSLDTKTEKLIQQAIEELVRGRTSIVIAHRLSTIKNAHKIVVIEQGRVAEEGSLAELLDKKGKFYGYWQEQKFY
ncbi:MAG: ABC transporter ATP-binding protein [Candidatus Omnitrophota bacterium]